MDQIEFDTWEECLAKINEIRAEYPPTALLFRGQPEANWPLQTTLERFSNEHKDIAKYYRTISRIRAEIESFTGHQWEVPIAPDIDTMFPDYDTGSRRLHSGDIPAVSYLAHLRHHGFPSPLLDWSSTPQVAAFFAFREPSASGHSAIFVYCERPKQFKIRSSDSPTISRIGPNLRTHRRHFLQQSEYTLCTRYIDKWMFESHECIFGSPSPDQDLLWKFVMPSSCRHEVLRGLEEFNLNAFSLFGSEESLMQTLAERYLWRL